MKLDLRVTTDKAYAGVCTPPSMTVLVKDFPSMVQ